MMKEIEFLLKVQLEHKNNFIFDCYDYSKMWNVPYVH